MGIPRIIGLSGKIGSGKTTVTKKLLKKYPEYKRIAFGDMLKKEASEMYNFPLEWAYDEEGKSKTITTKIPKKEKNKTWKEKLKEFVTCKIDYDKEFHLKDEATVREILQWHGTEFRRNQDPNYWVKQMKNYIVNNPWVIIDDVRFFNEADMVRNLGGILIRIEPHNKWKPGKYANHSSETSLDDYTKFDLIIKQLYNNPDYTVDCISNFIQNLN